MNIIRFAAVAIFLLTSQIPGFSQNMYQGTDKKFEIQAGPDFRGENFNWSIDGTVNGKYINVLSELKYNNIQAKGFYINGRYHLFKNIGLSLSYNKLFTISGKATDFDYDGADRTEPVTQLYLRSHQGNMRHLNTALHYQVLQNERTTAGIALGYGLNKELFYLLDDNNKALRSTYEAQWNGPVLQLEGLWNTTDKIYTTARLRGNYFKYKAQANWNLIETVEHPVSFEHAANGAGLDVGLGLGYRFTRLFTTGIEANYSHWATRLGSDKLYLLSGSVLSTNMNGAYKNSISLRVLFNYAF